MKKLSTLLLLVLPLFASACATKPYQLAGNWDSMKYSDNAALDKASLAD